MSALPENISRVLAGEAPTHFLSIFPTWLTREEWEVQGFSKVINDEQESRLSNRVRFFRLLQGNYQEGLREVQNSELKFCADQLAKDYACGKAGGIYSCSDFSLIIEPSYLEDDADGLWIFSRESLKVIQALARKAGLFVLTKKSEQDETDRRLSLWEFIFEFRV